MAKSSMEIEGMKELQKTIQELMKVADPEKVEPIVTKASEKLINYGKPATPYDINRERGTHLRDAWVSKLMPRRRTKQETYAIAAIDRKKAPHAHLIEFGTVKAPAHPYFRPTWDKHKEEISRDIIDGINKEIDKKMR